MKDFPEIIRSFIVVFFPLSLAVGNAAGHVANIDGMTKQMKAFFHKFQDLVVDLHVFEEQNQLLVVYKSKRIAILNIVTFDVLQLVRDEEIHRPHDRFTASFFDREKYYSLTLPISKSFIFS